LRVVIMGNGIIGNLAALYLRRRLPSDVGLTIVGPESRGGLPVVGESTIEITAQFLENRLGLGEYLRKTHYPKYALTYYFKLDPANPEDRRYSVQCNERDPEDLAPLDGWEGPMARPPSWQLNRSVFDRDIQAMASATPGIERLFGKVKAVDLDAGGHRLTVDGEDGEQHTLEADWVIDATGRRQILAKQLGLRQRAREKQRDCFWFRLADFDRDILKDIEALGPMPPAEGEPYHYDRYYSTHHFMGKGNWIWLIPLRTEDGSELISIGLSTRPEVYPHDVRSIDAFMEHVGALHPVITELVASGRVLDTNTYANYRYVIDQAYSEDRWCIIGDAAFAPDPLFSNGLAFSTIQIEQVGEMIARDHAGDHAPEYIKKMEEVFWAPVKGSQNTIADWYETMDDPLLCAARLNFIEISYFYVLLPLVVNGCHYKPDRLDEWNFMIASGGSPLQLPKKLEDRRREISTVRPEHFIYQGKEKVNLKALTVYDEMRQMRAGMLAGAELQSQYVSLLMSRWEAPEEA